jgi:hypothetical protein
MRAKLAQHTNSSCVRLWFPPWNRQLKHRFGNPDRAPSPETGRHSTIGSSGPSQTGLKLPRSWAKCGDFTAMPESQASDSAGDRYTMRCHERIGHLT